MARNKVREQGHTMGGAAIEAIVSYSHRDEKFRQQLETHLSLLQRQGLLSVWHDRKIGAGTEWKNQIDERLDTAELILLLVSADFLASEYCYEIEMKRALERHASGTVRVVPIILRPVDWHHAPFANLQALPKDGKPVSRWTNRDAAWEDVVAGIRRTVRELRANVPPPRRTRDEILVADDDPRLSKLIARNLEIAQYRVTTVDTGQEVVTKARERAVDLVILDANLPRPNGLQIVRRIRKFSPVPILMLTLGSEADNIAALGSGADDYLAKPFGAPELIARVKGLLRRAKMYEART